jgi:hypothetical protein
MIMVGRDTLKATDGGTPQGRADPSRGVANHRVRDDAEFHSVEGCRTSAPSSYA